MVFMQRSFYLNGAANINMVLLNLEIMSISKASIDPRRFQNPPKRSVRTRIFDKQTICFLLISIHMKFEFNLLAPVTFMMKVSFFKGTFLTSMNRTKWDQKNIFFIDIFNGFWTFSKEPSRKKSRPNIPDFLRFQILTKKYSFKMSLKRNIFSIPLLIFRF